MHINSTKRYTLQRTLSYEDLLPGTPTEERVQFPLPWHKHYAGRIHPFFNHISRSLYEYSDHEDVSAARCFIFEADNERKWSLCSHAWLPRLESGWLLGERGRWLLSSDILTFACDYRVLISDERAHVGKICNSRR